MLENIAIVLATFMIPTAPLDTISFNNYSVYAEPAVVVQPGGNRPGVYTPNGTKVNAYFQEEADSDELNYLYTVDGNLCDYFYDADNTGIVSLKIRASKTYNGFAYAFHMNNGGNACLFWDIDDYINDKSFVEVSEPQEGDIVCYYAGDQEINAGIIKCVYDQPDNDDLGSNLLVESKWYPNGVYEHRGDLCPYMPKHNMTSSGPADRLVYYRRHKTHNFVAVKGSENGSEHTGKCDGCGYEKPVEHNYTYTDKTSTHHTANCDCGIKRTEEHTWTPVSNIGATRPGMVVRCISCSFLKRLNPDEFVPVIRPLKMPFDIKSLIK